MAVKVLSPVAMIVLILHSFKVVIVGYVASFNLFSITMMPRKVRSFSNLSLGKVFKSCIF
jgi:hypothetical protein